MGPTDTQSAMPTSSTLCATFSLKEELACFWARCDAAWPPSQPSVRPLPSHEDTASGPEAVQKKEDSGSEQSAGREQVVGTRGCRSSGGSARGRSRCRFPKRASHITSGTSGSGETQEQRNPREHSGSRADSNTDGATGLTPCAKWAGSGSEEIEPKRPRRKGWDVMPDPFEMMAQQKMMGAHCPKKRRECYCGNLAVGQVTKAVLWEALNSLFKALPSFFESYPDIPDPIRCMSFPDHRGLFAFVEFHDEVIASTAIHMSGFELCGRPVKVGRPQGYTPVPFGEPALDVEPLRQCGVIPPTPDVVMPSAKPLLADKLRELYFSNLLTGKVTEAMMIELLTPVCLELPEYDARLGPPIHKVTMSQTGQYCFVQFQNADIASRLMVVLDDTELLGRKLNVARPANYLQAQAALPAPHAPLPLAPTTAKPEAADPTEAFRAGAAAISGIQL